MYTNSRSLLAVAAFTLVTMMGVTLPSGPANADQGDCAQPLSTGASPVASDCLFILRAATGSETCDPACTCAPTGTLPIVATDALLCLLETVSLPTTLACDCADLQDAAYAFDPATDVVDAGIRPRFTANNHIGAFAQDLQPSTGDWTAGWTVGLHGNNTVWEPASGGTLAGGTPSADGSCPTGTTDIGDTTLPGGFAGSMDICQLAARYDTDGETISLTNDNIYRLGGAASQGTFIGDGDQEDKDASNTAEVTLDIEQGTLILGVESEALAVTRGSDLIITGTADDPVVMSSQTWFDAWLGGGDGSSGRGEWGGLVVTGFGIANQCNDPTFCDALVEGFLSPFPYGGLDNTDDSGDIQYLVVRHAGFDIDGNGNELNGITLYTLGHNTEISYVQVHRNEDDGIEFFGGAVVVDHAVLTGIGDDSLDSDLGFTGGTQYAVVKQFDDEADRGYESDSSDNPLDTPASAPTYANVTVLGSTGGPDGSPTGLIARSGTGGYHWNGIITGSERSCIRLDDNTLPLRAGTLSDPDDGTLQIHNYVVNCPGATNGTFEGESGVAGNETADVETWYFADTNNREVDPTINSATGYPTANP